MKLLEAWMNGHFKSSNAENDENQEEKKTLLRFAGLDSGGSVRFRPFSKKQSKLFFLHASCKNSGLKLPFFL